MANIHRRTVHVSFLDENEAALRPRTAADALEYPASWLRDLGLSLDIRCSCSWSQQPSFRMLLDANPQLAGVPLGRILARLRCTKTCRAMPIRVALIQVQEHASGRAGYGGWGTWELVLMGEAEPTA